jgi:hypothetical protein
LSAFNSTFYTVCLSLHCLPRQTVYHPACRLGLQGRRPIQIPYIIIIIIIIIYPKDSFFMSKATITFWKVLRNGILPAHRLLNQNLLISMADKGYLLWMSFTGKIILTDKYPCTSENFQSTRDMSRYVQICPDGPDSQMVQLCKNLGKGRKMLCQACDTCRAVNE